MFFHFLYDNEVVNKETSEQATFQNIKHVDDNGNEFWYARELQEVLEYKKWENFCKVIDKAKKACKGSGNAVSLHFPDVRKMIPIGNETYREVADFKLSKYACYLIAMNGDPRKEVIALAQTYFAVKTNEQEQLELQKEDSLRLQIRQDIKEHNISLAEAANQAGIKEPRDYAIFQNEGYKGLYGGLGVKQIQEKKGLKKSQKILDYMGSTELAANLFRATQTDEKLRRENIKGKEQANYTHYEVGKKVRQTIRELGGTMPEDLPTPVESIKQLEKKQKKQLKPSIQLKQKEETKI
ncbi:DNA damage-inducible protein D [Veillonella caviae]|uniref:DNA damage-inducible protein D n=1 Tax=Veillonella caviae TaxID=248316 RepID=UPI002A919017|nr:DNA damage-inducible protein D [Veillonella caviae]MDY5409161.1 DNA damage-inducible protein D [Veillonella caviae]